ncbi:MAG: molybdopterin-dependent oxidoreductase [Planctomycetales bacterium]|nr:molybdopterin-dependent oxidoreductase [Planctomycetales bacterium]NIM09117.1 molybdopterin-dependent oxidoreductase [Planctomycetales bacterium]NIN08588.1 molybdopterin-dependent oxidoreductase [Planctomycetales bacterium]NIN77710.1 molybdopterin-dependent oxidoreductase [Planctomycetales bacterium]NIO34886.1 molybdopterin-dependent oxidoreductase [Planctomycetales bacterium]
MGIVLINGQEVELDDDLRWNGIQAARHVGEEIPHYCWHPGLSVVASCRMCLVETGRRDPKTGEISMMPKLMPACQTPATDGSVFITDSEKVRNARAMVEEDLLINHPIDCPICDKAGECLLQDYHFQHGRDQRRADIRPFTSRRRSLGDTVTLFVDRCVMCSRCVRFTREITGTSELYVTGRGSSEEIDVFPGYPLANKMAGNVVDLCPVGALGDKDFLYQQRVWFMRAEPGVCAGCSSGCAIFVEQNQDRIYRLKPRENPHVNQWWICDEGRYGFHHVHSSQRLLQPRQRMDGQWAGADWSRLVDELHEKFSAAGHVAAVISPHLTVEEAYLLARYARSVDSRAVLVLGPVPVVGEDEQFLGGFTIRAEKCPNRRGVEEVIAHFGGPLATLDDLVPQVEEGGIEAVWVAGGYPAPWIDDATAQRLATAGMLVVQDLFDSPLSAVADYVLPAAAFAEREGSYVNCRDRLQSFRWAIRPPQGVRVEGSLYFQLLGQDGLYDARGTLQEIASQMRYFSAAAGGVPETGVDLKVDQLAS